jgi:hypothetical protein
VRSASPSRRQKVWWSTARGVADTRREQRAVWVGHARHEARGQASPSRLAGRMLGKEHYRIFKQKNY